MTAKELRQKYLDFFRDKGHAIIPSASLIPENDPTTLFTGSGMQPMLPYLLGEKHPEGNRIADSQKCFRSVEIDEDNSIGDNRHATFFEMLGNWSLGDYFKEEQIAWMFEFLTKELGLDPKRIYPTVFRGNKELDISADDESAKIWQEEFKKVGIEAKAVDFAERDGMQDGRIFYYDETKNWWSRSGVPKNMPNGEPGGPDSEMFFDFGEELGLHEKSEWKVEPCHVNCDCGRFVEIGNNVFMAYVKTKEGFKELSQKNVDFGGGLERLAMALQGHPDMFLIDLFEPLRTKLEEISQKKYGEDEKETIAFRIIMDHIRAATFLISDSAVPSNKDQGYYTRRLIRRSVRFARQLAIKKPFTHLIAEEVISKMGEYYSELKENKNLIIEQLVQEEEKFGKTLEKGLKEFEKKSGNDISAKDAFYLYESFGFPLEITVELANEKGLSVDEQGFMDEFKKHQELSREGASQKFAGGLADHSEIATKYHTTTHLLQQALRQVLGDHVAQKGSNITEKRLRFDFTHNEKMTDEQKKQVEDIVNQKISEDLKVECEEMTPDAAKEKGAVGLFGEKYGEKVKVYSIGNSSTSSEPPFSREICGGPHVENTGSLGKFKIKKEESSSAGVRRIKAVLE